MIDKDRLDLFTEFATTRAIPKVQIDTADLVALCEDAAMLRRLTVDVEEEKPASKKIEAAEQSACPVHGTPAAPPKAPAEVHLVTWKHGPGVEVFANEADARAYSEKTHEGSTKNRVDCVPVRSAESAEQGRNAAEVLLGETRARVEELELLLEAVGWPCEQCGNEPRVSTAEVVYCDTPCEEERAYKPKAWIAKQQAAIEAADLNNREEQHGQTG